ncbi:hypothetical protein Acr_13g0006120 [Actinidia rufa]|uniref:CCHC-type domain-containing protein n=1 Tax=Actinidia rufa TaxID=165716 RepID=A0A7J0FKI1_9ERIC|nr:hypothetical protein Acr_13g0006120 [Actinidia rufa]
MREDAIEGRLTEMDNTRGSGQEGGNDNPQMTELRNMPQEIRELDLSRAETQQGETSEYRGVTEDPVIPMESVAVKVEIGSYLLAGEASRWWNLKGVREPGMDWARFKVIFREKFVPRAVQNAKCSEFEHLKQLGTTIADYEGSFTNLAEYAPHLVATDEMRACRFEDGLRHKIKRVIRLLVLPTYAEVLDRAIIVEQDEIERKKYFDRASAGVPEKCGRYHWGVCWKDRIEVRNEIRCFHCNEMEHIKRNCPRLRTEAVAPKGRPGGGNMTPAGNTRPGGNRLGNSGNRDGNVNNQRQGRAFALMPGDARNTEDVVAGMGLQFIA